MEREIKVVIIKAAEYKSVEDYKANPSVSTKTIKDDLQTFYDEIGCEYIDIPIRKVGGKKYCFICNESGALVDKPRFTALCKNTPWASVPGTCIITGPADEDGNLTSLTDADIRNIVTHITIFPNDKDATTFSPAVILD